MQTIPKKKRAASGRARLLLLLAAALVLLAVSCLASVAFGARAVSFETLVQALTAFDPENGDHAVVLSRVPRTVLGLLAGGALGLAGAGAAGVRAPGARAPALCLFSCSCSCWMS